MRLPNVSHIIQVLRDQADDDLPMYGDDVIDGEAFPARGNLPHSEQNSQGSEQSVIIESTSTVTAPMRRRNRAVRTLAIDATVELRSRDLVDWNNNYLNNMTEASRAKNKKRILDQAKENAEHYLWGSGLGGIASHMAGAVGPTPFDRFIGDNLFELFTGISRNQTAGTKHDRDSGIDEATQAEGRRVRRKLDESEDQFGRGDQDEGVFLGANNEEVELPRESASALDDQEVFSAMPWNTSASVRGSSVLPRSGRPGMMGDQARPGSRMVSASPLLRHSRTGYLEGLESLKSDGEFYTGDEFALLAHNSDTSEALALSQPSIRVREALSAEGENFISFVADAIAEKREAEPAALIDSVTFEDLLPPIENNKVVACQGLMMILALGTKDMLDVQQPEDFGDINLKLKEHTKIPEVFDISDEQESDHIMDTEDEPGHFAEQFAAGHAADGENERDSLYD
jgi:meiotic recombination protein REC8